MLHKPHVEASTFHNNDTSYFVFHMQMVQAIMLAPSKELCRQIKENLSQLTTLCKREVRFIDVSPTVPLEAQRPLLVGEFCQLYVGYSICLCFFEGMRIQSFVRPIALRYIYKM